MPSESDFQQRTFGEEVGLPPVVAQEPGPVDSDAPVACVNCAVEMDQDDVTDNAAGEHYCEECYSAAYTTCKGCSDEVDRDNSTASADGDDYCKDCYGERYTVCTACNDEIEIGGEDEWYAEIGRGRNTETDGPYCQSCYDDRFNTCAGCNRTFRSDDTTRADGDEWCNECYCERYSTCEGCYSACDRESMHYDESSGYDYCEDCYNILESDESDESEGSNRRGTGGTNQNYIAKPFQRSTRKSRRVGSLRTYGVELETSYCGGYEALAGEYSFAAKPDGSISAKEFASAILSGDEGLEEIERWCEKANELDFAVNNKCGFHLHVDVSDLSTDQRCNILEAYLYTYSVWAAFMDSERRNNKYCRAVRWNVSDLNAIGTEEEFNGFCDGQSRFEYPNDSGDCGRYRWINVMAYTEHGTFELRLHSATVNGEKVCNWVKAHVKFVDCVKNLAQWDICAMFRDKTDSEKFAALAKLWGDKELADFYKDRAAGFGTELGAPSRATGGAALVA